jgi:hypothetical protein
MQHQKQTRSMIDAASQEAVTSPEDPTGHW